MFVLFAKGSHPVAGFLGLRSGEYPELQSCLESAPKEPLFWSGNFDLPNDLEVQGSGLARATIASLMAESLCRPRESHQTSPLCQFAQPAFGVASPSFAFVGKDEDRPLSWGRLLFDKQASQSLGHVLRSLLALKCGLVLIVFDHPV